jgi:hypothetical protein
MSARLSDGMNARSHRSQRGMPVAPYPLPRARGDAESAATSRLFARRCVVAFAAAYLALAIGGAWIALS